MRIDYSDGSFMLAWDKCRAWYFPDGALKDCEYKRWYKGMPVTAAVAARHVKVREYLASQGKSEAELLQRGILKRKQG